MTSATQTWGLEPDVVESLRGQLHGVLMLDGESGYDEARTVWNAMIDRRPALIARCADTADVVAGVNYAREHGLPLSIKGGGHNIAGLAVGEGSLMLDMSAMREIQVDPARRIARAQPGCLLSDLDRETQEHGLAAVLGFISATGIAGLTLGGGFGYLTRRFGWTCAPRTRTPTCSGACVAAAATSALSPALSITYTRSGRTSSAEASPGRPRTPAKCWPCTAIGPPRPHRNIPASPCCAKPHPRRG